MLTTIAPREVETINVAETAEFSIKANGKAFKVLIDGLYSDKIRAVVREIWSNAFDSHIAAGKPDDPFDCHLPTPFEPWFSVRDYGVSLSHVGVMKLYTTVFESSKEDTNTQVGKLGLGSKSPFAYVDTFTVTAWKDGEKRLYSAYIGEDYIPRISLMASEPTDEPQGLEITFPVKTQDCSDFRIAAQRTALGFDTVPTILGSDQIQKVTREVLAEGDGWKLYATSEYGLRAHAKQGCVVYPIDVNAVVGLSSTQRTILNGCVFIDFPIGDLEITASREGLGYDEQTCKNIVARVTAIEQEMTAQIEARLASCKTYHDVLMEANRLRNFDIPESLRQLVNNVKWRGKPMITKFYLNPKQFVGAEVSKIVRDSIKRKSKLEQYFHRGAMYIDPADTVFYFHAWDQPVHHAARRIQHHYLDVLSRRPHDIVVIRAKPGSMAMKRLLVALGRPDPSTFIDVTQLPKPPSTASNYYERKPVMVRIFGRSTDFRDWDQCTTSGGIYIPMDRNDIIQPNGNTARHAYVRDIIEALRTAEIIDESTNIYAVPKSIQRVLKSGDWTNLFELAEKTLTENFDEDALHRVDQLKRFFGHVYRDSSIEGYIKELVKTGKVEPDCFMTGVMQAAVEAVSLLHLELTESRLNDGVLMLAKTMERINDDNELPSLDGTVVDSAAIAETYPLIASLLQPLTVSTLVNNVSQEAVLEYVNLIDASNNS